ncbi:MAG: DNRLRE domain-containing protein, partial [Dehalococcoidia bacterium]
MGVPSLSRLASLLVVAAWVALMLALAVFPARSEGAETRVATFTSTEDTYFKDTRPDRNYGDASTLEADHHPSVKRALIRFRVSGIPDDASVASATLRLFVADRSKVPGDIHAVEGDWSEATTVWNNAPSVGRKIDSFSGTADRHTWKEANVTSAVAGNGLVDFFVVSNSSDGVDFRSSEGTSNQPTLVVEWTGPTSPGGSTPAPAPAPPPAPTPTPTPAPAPAPAPAPEPPPAAGTAYYVDSASGNDANSGTSEADAWRTLDRASTASLRPGERLLLKRGEVFAGTLTISSSGTRDAPVVISSYGSGTPPTITGGSSCVVL